MSKKLFYILFFFLNSLLTFAQNVGGWANNHLNVYTYNGAIANEAFTVRLDYTGTYLNIPNWKLSVQLIQPFQSGGAIFPLDKIKLIPTRTEGQTNFPGPLPTIERIGVISPVSLNGMSETYIVPSSNTPIYHKSDYSQYYDLQMKINLLVEGGAYLEDLQEKTFRGTFRFTYLRQDNSVIGIFERQFTIQIHKLSGTPPAPENKYSISFSADATNAQIEYNSISDYVNGKSVTYEDGLTITANTNYQLSVRSVESNFTSPAGNTLPLDIVSLQLVGPNGSGTSVPLSSNGQPLLQGQSTSGSPQGFDIRYFTKANDERLHEVRSEQYSTQLMFEITPR